MEARREPDEYVLWRMIEGGDMNRARARFEALRRAFPDWKPTPDLNRALSSPAERRDSGAKDHGSAGSAGLAAAWSLYNDKRYEAAARAFVEASGGEPSLERFEERVDNRFFVSKRENKNLEHRDDSSKSQYALEAVYGAALSFHGLGREEEAAAHAETAIRLAEATHEDASAYRNLLAAIRFKQLQTSYDAGRYEAALAFARGVPPEHEGYDGARRLGGWAALKAGRADEAREIFSRAYAVSRSEGDAQGLFLAARAGGGKDELVAEPGEPLAVLIERAKGERAFYDKDFLRALRLNAPQAESLAGIDRPWAGASVRARRIDGVPGENRLLLVETAASAGASFGGDVVDATLSTLQVSSGDGTGFDTFIAPRIAWAREGGTDFAAALGATPLGGPVGALPTANFGARRTYEKGEIAAQAYVRPREDSVLSFVGRFDPAMNAGTGRVVAIGAETKTRVAISERWSISSEAAGETLHGRNVIGNTRVRASFAAGAAFFPESFDYFVAGPFVRIEHYERNTDYFTFGHGGYFSPDFYVQSGLALNFMTPELRRSIWKLDAEIAGEHMTNSSAYEFPLTNGGSLLPGSSSSGVSGSLGVRYRRLVGEHWVLGADIRLVRSAAYDEMQAGLSLRRVFGARKTLVSRDIEPLSRKKSAW